MPRRRKETSIKPCRNHLLGYYFDNDIRIIFFAIKKDLKKTISDLMYWNYCPLCGTILTKRIKERQLGDKYDG